MKVTQLINKNGNAANNQFVIITDKGLYFKSYNTLIAFVDNNGNIELTSDYCASNATLKHLKIFLDIELSKKEIEKEITKGNYKLNDNLTIS